MKDVNTLYNRLKFKQNLSTILAFVLPQQCILCSRIVSKVRPFTPQHQSLCEACVYELPWHTQAQCPQCALPTPNGDICGVCLQHPPAFDRTIALLKYAYPMDSLIQKYKYGKALHFSRMLSQLAYHHSDLSWLLKQHHPPRTLIAMPMHENRLKTRGFNHALEIAKDLNQALKLNLVIDDCARIKDTPPQAGLDLKARTRNMRDAFAMRCNLKGEHIMLFDDVMTTGASLHALAQTAKLAGASQVTCLVIARTLKSE